MIPVRLKTPKTKYKNKPTTVDGWRFDSKRESELYQVLREEQRIGLVNYFLRQVPIHLAPGGNHKKTPVLMRIDFQVHYIDGTVRYLDAKGHATPDWLNKAALAESLYGIRIETW